MALVARGRGGGRGRCMVMYRSMKEALGRSVCLWLEQIHLGSFATNKFAVDLWAIESSSLEENAERLMMEKCCVERTATVWYPAVFYFSTLLFCTFNLGLIVHCSSWRRFQGGAVTVVYYRGQPPDWFRLMPPVLVDTCTVWGGVDSAMHT